MPARCGACKLVAVELFRSRRGKASASMIRRCPSRSTGVYACLRRSRCLCGRCPWLSACRAEKLPRARTYGGQRHRAEYRLTSFVQVNGHVEWQAGAYCKTVGSAYVGSNPTPATTCGNGPSAAETRSAGRFLRVTACISLCHCGPVCCGVRGRRLGRQDGRCAPLAFPRTATDGPRRRAFPGLMCTAEPSVYP